MSEDEKPQPSAAEAAEALERGRLLFAQACGFVAGAATLEQIPPGGLPEVCFAGRSNVGKSSLINALTGRSTLARVSITPGRTRQINFFDLGGRLTLADLPGYGYAKASKQQVANWTRLVELYLVGRAPLRRALLLIDSRHGPKDVDRAVMAMLDQAAVAYQVVLTKVDQLRPAELAERIEATARELGRHAAAHPTVLATSAEKGTGIAGMRAELAALT
ncbi:MAG TPA: ribosome biogenesis GTP-binding protein YihA/YsxC [Rhodospirillales bacterium]|nr:ribosome biogenesis GTP-binding protein YihA/YsxC [Rhodospirillales bacterium]